MSNPAVADARAHLCAAAHALLKAAAAVRWDERRTEDDPVIEATIATLRAVVEMDPADLRCLEQLAMLLHNVGRLNEAAVLYAEVNRRDPPHPLNDRQRQAIEILCPRLMTTSAEWFPLVDCAAIHHPVDPVVAYHLFWEDDWDYPDDDEPCDHEVVWVRYRPPEVAPVGVTTYFHGRILAEDVSMAARPVVCVQWGKHGSLPASWEHMNDVRTVLRRDFDAALRGGRMSEHPRKRAWPSRFPGGWTEYTQFDHAVDPLTLIRTRKSYTCARWANAVLQDLLIPSNFHAKREWPEDGLVNL